MSSGIGQTIRIKRIRQLVSEAPLLKYCVPKEELTLQSDVSQTGLSAVLTQKGQPLAFANRALLDEEARFVSSVQQRAKGNSTDRDHKPLEAIVKKPLHVKPK